MHTVGMPDFSPRMPVGYIAGLTAPTRVRVNLSAHQLRESNGLLLGTPASRLRRQS